MVITPSGAYCRPENRDSLMVGWAHKADSEPSFDWEDQDEIEADFSHSSGLDSKAFEAWEAIATALPPIAEFDGITSTTSGYYGTTLITIRLCATTLIAQFDPSGWLLWSRCDVRSFHCLGWIETG